MRGGRGGTRWEGPLAGFELLAAFSFSAVCAGEMSSPAGMTQGSHTANAPRWLSRFRAKSPAAPPATARLCRPLGSALRRRASPRPGPSAGRPFPSPHLRGPSERAAAERCASTVTGDCPPPRQLWPPPCLHARRRSGDSGWAPRHVPTTGPGAAVPPAANARQAACRGAPPAGSAVLLTARVRIPPNRCGGGRPRVPTHNPA